MERSYFRHSKPSLRSHHIFRHTCQHKLRRLNQIKNNFIAQLTSGTLKIYLEKNYLIMKLPKQSSQCSNTQIPENYIQSQYQGNATSTDVSSKSPNMTTFHFADSINAIYRNINYGTISIYHARSMCKQIGASSSPWKSGSRSLKWTQTI